METIYLTIVNEDYRLKGSIASEIVGCYTYRKKCLLSFPTS
jgi:hypothetical protein